MKKALKDYRVVGLNNNLKFLKRVFNNSIFHEGNYDTGFIEQNIDSLLNKDKEIDIFDLVSAVVVRSVTNGHNINLPNELVDFKNVKGQKEVQTITVHDTSLAGDLKFEVVVYKVNSKKGSATILNKIYHY
jgi:acetyl/propionyl-CoA carboxylase alpha subunit